MKCIERASITKKVSYGWMVSTIRCETGGTFRPSIVSPDGIYHGLGQFDSGTWASTPYARYSWHSAKWNALAMAWLERTAGPGRWPVCG